jgi:hypothetical protein
MACLSGGVRRTERRSIGILLEDSTVDVRVYGLRIQSRGMFDHVRSDQRVPRHSLGSNEALIFWRIVRATCSVRLR